MTSKEMYQGIKEKITDDARYDLLLDELKGIVLTAPAYDVKNIFRRLILKEYIEERAVAIANYIIDHNATVNRDC